MDGVKGCRCHAVAQQLSGIGTDQSHVAQPAFTQPGRREELIRTQNLDADEIYLGEGLSRPQQEQTFSEANLQLDGMIISENHAPV
jgi:hypothetical protein